MSTDYKLLEKEEGYVEVWEHSCKFDVAVITNKSEPYSEVLHNLTLDELKEMNKQLTNVISYFDPDYHECKTGY